MPRKLNPGSLGVGTGVAPSSAPAYALIGVGPGQIGNATVPRLDMSGVVNHVQQATGAHPASAVEHDANPDLLISGNVDGALDELVGALPIRPPMIGEVNALGRFSIPDWGMLKLNDASLIIQGGVPTGNDPSTIYPYYWAPPAPTLDLQFFGADLGITDYADFIGAGRDPKTDLIWNSGINVYATLPGGGIGKTHAGAFTRASGEVARTRVLLRNSTDDPNNPGFPVREAVTLSGFLFPADRGVLALLHFPPSAGGDLMTEYLAQPLLDRVVAALLLGQGLLGTQCSDTTTPCDVATCDGSPGGVFGIGADNDPFAYPGRASGQYDLEEIHTGISALDGSALTAPWNDFDGDTVAGAQRPSVTNFPAPGQVRLGTDPEAGVTPVTFGIPILGGTLNAYTPAAQAAIPTEHTRSLNHIQVVGQSVVGPNNFFRYRLPYLESYSAEGLKWTPTGQDPYTSKEIARYFTAATPNSGSWTVPTGQVYPIPAGLLGYAGQYEDPFDRDYWTWQVARYRHQFTLPVSAATGAAEESGTYMLVHFKREHDFEAFTVRGIGWWHATQGYEVYGAHTLHETGGVTDHVEHDGNLVNVETSTAVPSPAGPAPAYGYEANPYHVLRSTVFQDPAGSTAGALITGTYNWAANSTGADEGVTHISGVTYFVPRLFLTDTTNVYLTDMSIQGDTSTWNASYGTDSRSLTNGSVAPALLSSPDPLLVDMGEYLGRNLSTSTAPNAAVPVGAVPATDLTPDWDLIGLRNINVPFTYCGAYTDVAGPVAGVDTLSAGFVGKTFDFDGDQRDPVFSTNVGIRAFTRRPLRHNSSTYVGTGLRLTANPADMILWHSTGFAGSKVLAWDEEEKGYGNFTTVFRTYRVLLSKYKDVEERFLDETYRYRVIWSNVLQGSGIAGYDSAAADAAIQGPGLGTWVGGPIEVPVKASMAPPPWSEASWIEDNALHLAPLPVSELQVAGLPDRNPPLSAGAAGCQPMSGVLIHPKTDYSAAVPTVGVHYLGFAQPDYSGYTGTRYYMRAFDLNFVNWTHGVVPPGPTKVRNMEGSSTFTLRLDGITLENFRFLAPGPGCLLSDGLSIEIKVPGLTTWMDAGRPDGAGPSKQDTLLDGAGCLVVGSDSYNFVDPVTKMVGCYLKISVGPTATLFRGTGTKNSNYTDQVGWDGRTNLNECPVLVRVGMTENSRKFDLQYRCVSHNSFVGGVDPNQAPGDVRGLIGISVVHETVDTLIAP